VSQGINVLLHNNHLNVMKSEECDPCFAMRSGFQGFLESKGIIVNPLIDIEHEFEVVLILLYCEAVFRPFTL